MNTIDCSPIVLVLARWRFQIKEIFMDIKEAFASALKQARNVRGLTQEDFSDVSSRTYISTLERGLKSPTIDKINVLAKVIGVHPLSLLTLAYLTEANDSTPKKLLARIESDLKLLNRS